MNLENRRDIVSSRAQVLIQPQPTASSTKAFPIWWAPVPQLSTIGSHRAIWTIAVFEQPPPFRCEGVIVCTTCTFIAQWSDADRSPTRRKNTLLANYPDKTVPTQFNVFNPSMAKEGKATECHAAEKRKLLEQVSEKTTVTQIQIAKEISSWARGASRTQASLFCPPYHWHISVLWSRQEKRDHRTLNNHVACAFFLSHDWRCSQARKCDRCSKFTKEIRHMPEMRMPENVNL